MPGVLSLQNILYLTSFIYMDGWPSVKTSFGSFHVINVAKEVNNFCLIGTGFFMKYHRNLISQESDITGI